MSVPESEPNNQTETLHLESESRNWFLYAWYEKWKIAAKGLFLNELIIMQIQETIAN